MANEGLGDYTKSAVNNAGLVSEGVVSGVVIMALPMLLMGLGIGLGLLLIRTPVKIIGGV